MCTYQYVRRSKMRKTKEKNEKIRTNSFKEKERKPKKDEEEEYILRRKEIRGRIEQIIDYRNLVLK